MALAVCRPRACEAVPEADLRKAFSALLMCQEQGAACSKHRYGSCELEESELCSVHGVVKELLCLQEGSAAGVPQLPGVQEATGHKQGDATCECAVSEDVENGFCTSDGSVKKPLRPQSRSATGNIEKRTLSRFPGKCFRCHPLVTLVLILLLILVVALVVALAVQSAGSCAEIPATPVAPLLLARPHGWVGYHGLCYLLSRDHGSWEQGQDRCSRLGASLAVLKDEELDFLFRLCWNVDYWLGLRRRGQRLQWGDGSNFSSSVPVLGNSECVFLGDGKFRSTRCSNQQPYLCSRAQTQL